MKFFLCLFFAIGVAADSAFRFGGVFSTIGEKRDFIEAKNGYQLYFDVINAENDNRGFWLEGKNATQGFHFQFRFLAYEDRSDAEIHRRHIQKLIRQDRVHFLGGSHPAFAETQMRLADKDGVLNYHCCAGPDYLYKQNHPTVYGIQVSNSQYTKLMIRSMQVANVRTMVFVFQQDDPFTRTTCETANRFYHDSNGVWMLESGIRVMYAFNKTLSGDVAEEIAKEVQENEIEVVVACVFPDDGKVLVEAFHQIRYPLKGFFLTVGPTKQDWIDDLEPPAVAEDLLSAAQWHHGLNYTDAFFGSAEGYTQRYREKFDGQTPTYVAAGASAVGLTLTHAIREAFADCDISATLGDVDALLYNTSAIQCDGDGRDKGYERVLDSLAALEMEETFFGGIEFDEYRRNVRLDPVTTQVVVSKDDNGKTCRKIVPVLPVGHATELLNYPARNRYREKCMPGSFVGPDPFDPCEVCTRGEFSDQYDADHCDYCPIGTWSDQLAQNACMPCPEGTTTTVRGAKDIKDCVCRQGFVNREMKRGAACKPCPEGAECQGEMQPPIPLEGYWTSDLQRNEVYSCDPPSSCIGGPDRDCQEGHTGR